MLLIVRGDFYSWCTKVGIFLKWYWTAAYLYVTSFIALIYHGCWRERTTAQDVIVFFAINMNRGNSGQSSLCMLCCGSCVCTQTSEYTVDSWELLSAGQPGKPLVHDFLVYFRPIKLNPEQCSPHMERTSELYDFIFCVGRQPTICIYVVHFVYRPLLTLCCCMDDCELSVVFLWSSCARICNDKVIFHTSAFKACLCIILKEKRFFFYKTCFY